MIVYFIIFVSLVAMVVSQKTSPCPQTFSYDTKRKDNIWYGTISYRSAENFMGIWLHIVLDRPADILGNWFGHVSTCDNTIFVIRKTNYVLLADFPLIIPFFVKFNPAQVIPSIETIKLNGKTICSNPENQIEIFSASAASQINVRSKESANGNEKQSDISPINILNFNNPTKSKVEVTFLPEDDEGDDSETLHFAGDFNLQKSPIQSRTALKLTQDNEKPSNCGTIAPRNYSISPQDEDTWPGQWPWHAALYYPEETKLVYLCGATLITEQHVIVPAHCVTVPYSKRPLHVNKLLVSLGKYNLNKLGSNVDIQDRGLSDIFVHPEYNFTIYLHDIAVLRFLKPIKITDFVRPCCLWQENTNLEDILGKEGTIVGWGSDKNNRLMHEQMHVAPTENCIFAASIPDTYYCAEFQNGTSGCKILSTGGMIFPKQGTTDQNTIWQVRGLNVHSNIQESCDKIKNRIFTDVAKYIPWINDVILK